VRKEGYEKIALFLACQREDDLAKLRPGELNRRLAELNFAWFTTVFHKISGFVNNNRGLHRPDLAKFAQLI
jgi:hypothetical protein